MNKVILEMIMVMTVGQLGDVSLKFWNCGGGGGSRVINNNQNYKNDNGNPKNNNENSQLRNISLLENAS
jgi:hypothetical protein